CRRGLPRSPSCQTRFRQAVPLSPSKARLMGRVKSESLIMDLENDSEPETDGSTLSPPSRTRARLAAVQALYQMDLTQRDLSAVLDEFLSHRFSTAEIYAGADQSFFSDIASGVAHAQAQIDREVTAHLAEGWRLSRIDSILRAILRSGVYEILERS